MLDIGSKRGALTTTCSMPIVHGPCHVRNACEADRQHQATCCAQMTNEARNVEQEANHITHAEVRAVRTVEQREAHAARHAVMLEEARREIRRNDRATRAEQRATVPNRLLQTQREFDGNNKHLRHKLGRMEVQCDHCDILHWIEKRVMGSS